MPAELDAYIGRALQDWGVPGAAVAIVKDGRVVAATGYGVRRLSEPQGVDAHTVFDIASLAKSFTASATAVLVDEGKLRWDDTLRVHLPSVELPDACLSHEVTLRDLLAHRVGLEPGNAMFRLAGFDTKEMLGHLRYLKARSPLRTDLVYSNVLYTAAGEAAAAAAGTDFRTLVTTRLLQPLGMGETRVGANLLEQPNAASPHAVLEGRHQPIRWRTMDHNTDPAGGMVSSAADMAKWLLFHLGDGTWEGKRIISPQSMEEMRSPQNIIRTTPAMRSARLVEHFAAYGFGWNVMDYRGRPMLWHSGNGDGMPVYMAVLPNEQLGVLVMLNTWNAPLLHGALANRIADFYLGAPPRDWSGEALGRYRKGLEQDRQAAGARDSLRDPDAKPRLPLERYAGKYSAPLYDSLLITQEAAQLTLQVGKGQKAHLEHWHHDTFRVRWHDAVFREFYPAFLTFTFDEAGRVDGLKTQFNRDRVEAPRLETPGTP
ncbi:MAG: serine hydrolase [Acidobacteria bacterium]|nr:serine hydrolase [Acidobacteriota bacterium]